MTIQVEKANISKVDMKYLLRLNDAAAQLHMRDIITDSQRRTIHKKLCKLRDRMVADFAERSKKKGKR